MEKKNDVDIMLDLIEFNSKKHKIIMQMMEEEAKGNFGKEYIDLIKSYEVVYWYINKELNMYPKERKMEVLDKILSINSNIGGYIPFMSILENKENKLPLQRTVMDLGATFINFYSGEDSHKSAKNILMEMLGIESNEEIKENSELINSCMINDYLNMLLSVIMEDIKTTNNINLKKVLLKLKYNLIFISETLEDRAINTKFLIPEKPSLVSELLINTANITKNEYLMKSDIVFSGLLEKQILEAVDKVYKHHQDTIRYFDHLLIKTYANLITDKELCNYLVMEPTDEMLPNIKRATITINDDLTKGANVDITDRKIMRI